MELLVVTLLNGASYGLLLFMLASGLTLIFSMMGVLNFAHASFYMLGAYVAYSVSAHAGFWMGLLVAPLVVGALGALVERYALRAVHKHGHVSELLFTFGLAYIVLEAVQFIWGRQPVPYTPPGWLDGPLFTLFNSAFPRYRAFMMLAALTMLASLYAVLRLTRIGLVIQASLQHPEMVESLGHNVPGVFMLLFGAGSALAALAGAIGGAAFVTEPVMAGAMGSIVFVVVIVGGLGSLSGALVASLLIGIVQTYAVSLDYSLSTLLTRIGTVPAAPSWASDVLSLTVADFAPLLPYVLLIGVLILRPRGLLGTRET